jgi:hypothetical protein
MEIMFVGAEGFNLPEYRGYTTQKWCVSLMLLLQDRPMLFDVGCRWIGDLQGERSTTHAVPWWQGAYERTRWGAFFVPVAHGTLRMGDPGTLNPVMVLIYSCPLWGWQSPHHSNPGFQRITASLSPVSAEANWIYPNLSYSERDRHHIIARSVFSRAARQLVVNKNPSRKVPGGFGKLFSFGHSERKESQFLSKS